MTSLEAHSLYMKSCDKLKKIETSKYYEIFSNDIERMRDFIKAEKVRMRLWKYYMSKIYNYN